MKIVITSGYFSVLHVGHVRYFNEAQKYGDHHIVIVNSDKQQILKKGYIIVPEDERVEVVSAIASVDEVFLSIDEDRSVVCSLEALRDMYPEDEIIFANGGDRRDINDIPEGRVCQTRNIEMVFSVGGSDKANSTSDIVERILKNKGS